MSEQRIGTIGGAAALISDGAYATTATAMINEARHVAMSMIFIVDSDPIEDDALAVDGLLSAMAEAHWRGLATRLVIGGSRVNGPIQDACMAARDRAVQLGIPCRLVSATEQQSVHSKVLVADSFILMGSHNWSPGALGGTQSQDSVLIEDAALSGLCLSRILGRWMTSAEEGFDVPD